jgi:hypothetical protein
MHLLTNTQTFAGCCTCDYRSSHIRVARAEEHSFELCVSGGWDDAVQLDSLVTCVNDSSSRIQKLFKIRHLTYDEAIRLHSAS